MKLKPAEDALLEKSAYLESILRSPTDIAIIAADPNLEITYYNPAAENIYGRDTEEALGKNALDILSVEETDINRIKKAVSLASKEGKSNYELRYRKHGKLRFLDCQVSEIRDSNNAFLGYVFISKDITVQKNDEAQLNAYLHYLESIERINQIIHKAKDTKKMMKNIVDCMLTIFSCDRAWLLYPCSPDADFWRVPVEATNPSYPGAFAEKAEIPIEPAAAELFQLALSTNAPIVYDPTTKRQIPSGDKFSIRSQMILAIHPRLGEPWLLGIHQCSHPRIWTNEEKHLFQDIGHRLTDGISNLLYHQRLDSTRQDWEESLDAVVDHISICDMSGKITLANQAMREYFASMFTDLIGSNYRTVYFGKEECNSNCPCSITLSNGEPVETEIQLPTMGGWQQMSVYPKFNTTGEQTGAVLVVRDITRIKLNEEELRESKERYQTLVETMTEGLGVQDKNGTIQYVNGRLCEMLGYCKEDFIGQNISYFVGKSNISDWQEKMQHRRKGNAQAYEAEVKHRDGHKVLLHVSPQTITDSSGEFMGSFAVFTDLTERKQTEDRIRKLSQVVEQSPNAIIIMDKDGIIEYTNPSFTKTSGYLLQEAIGQTPTTLQSCDSSASTYQELWQTISSGKTWTGEVTHKRKDNSTHLDYLVVSPIKDSIGNITHYASNQTDITKRREAEEIAQFHQAELAHVTRVSTLGEMASGLAHELNQPLTAIASYSEAGLEMLRTSDFPIDKLSHILEQSHSQARRAGKIIQRIRRMVKKEKSHKTCTDINKLIKEASSLIIAELRNKKITLKLNLAEHLPNITMDGIQIEQVILNLLRNALDAMDLHGTLSISSSITDNSHLMVCIDDTGTGMDKKTRDNLFTPFYTSKPGGLGVGLSLSRSIIESHGGRLWLDTKHTKTTRFCFTLPFGSTN